MVSFAAVFSVVTQRSSSQTTVCDEDRCVTTLQAAAKDTSRDQIVLLGWKSILDPEISLSRDPLFYVLSPSRSQALEKN